MEADTRNFSAAPETPDTVTPRMTPPCPIELPPAVQQFLSLIRQQPDEAALDEVLPRAQREALVRDHCSVLKEVVTWQFHCSEAYGDKNEKNCLRDLLRLLGPAFSLRLINAISSDVLQRRACGTKPPWRLLLMLFHRLDKDACPDHIQDLFMAVLNRGGSRATALAALIWTRYSPGQDFAFPLLSADLDSATQIIRELRESKQPEQHKLALAIAAGIRRSRNQYPDFGQQLQGRPNPQRAKHLAALQVGDVLQACRITALKDFGAFVAIAPGIDGLLHRSDMDWESPPTPTPPLTVDQRIDVMVLEVDDPSGHVLLGVKQLAFSKWENMGTTYAVGSVVRATVREKTKSGSGLVVCLDRWIEGFVSAGQMDLHTPKNLDPYIGNTYAFKVLKVQPDSKRVVLSRRAMLEVERLQLLKPGDTFRGKVIKLVDFGALIDLDGLMGLLHLTKMARGRVDHPGEVLTIGQEVECVALAIDWEKAQVTLGRKEPLSNPWDTVESRYSVGTKVKARVVKVVAYGAFVELEPCVQGFVHVKEVSWTRRIGNASEVFSEGQLVEAVVLSTNADERKISLGTRQLEPNPWDSVASRYFVGAKVIVKVTNVVAYGVFVEVEPGIEGLIHVSELSPEHQTAKAADTLVKGQELEAVILAIQPGERRISLSTCPKLE